MCPCFYLNNIDRDRSNLWVLDDLCAAQSGGTGTTGDPLVEEKLLLLCVSMTVCRWCLSLPIYLIFLFLALEKGPQCLVVKQCLLCRGHFEGFGFIICGGSVCARWEGEMPSGKSVRETVGR